MSFQDQLSGLQTQQTLVCMATGDFYGRAEQYILSLAGMLTRHVSQPFHLICITDRPRKLPDDIKQIDCSKWHELRRDGMRPTTLKLGLFNPGYLPFDDFLYLDLTLIIRKSLDGLLEYAQKSPAQLVIVQDWYGDTYNSCVMRIQPHYLRFIYDAFVAGVTFKQKTKGDQEFIFNAIRAHHREADVQLFPTDFIASFKVSTRLARHNSAAACQAIERACIVKFHGTPKVHQAMDPWYRFLKYGLGHLRYGRWGLPFSCVKLAREWKGR